MAEYGDYKKELKTLGDLRTFVNETLKGIEDDYTFDIDDDFMGIDIILTANCDVSYSSKSFYWTANVNFVNDVKKAVEDMIKARHKIKALEIIKEKRIDIESFYTSFIEGDYDYSFYERRYGTYGKYCLTEEEFNLLKEVLE